MNIILFKRDVLFIVLQVSVFWNFCNGYIQLCQNSNIRSPNGKTVTVEIGKPASVLFCVTSDRTLSELLYVDQPSHRRGTIRVKEFVVSKFIITNKINITIDNVQRNDLNVSFSVKVYAELSNGGVDYRDFIILSFILREQSRLELCQNNMKGSANGTTFRAEIGGLASVSFCVISDTTLHNQVFISQPPHRSGWSPGSEKGVDVQFVSEDNYLTVNIIVQDITDKDINTAFIMKVFTDRHFENSQTNKEFIILTFVLQETRLNIITDETQTDDISTTTMAPMSICQTQITQGCPENWLSGKDMCLRVIPREHLCSVYGAELPEETLASYLTACLTYLLENTSSTVILLKSSKYFDVKTKSTTHEPENYQQICIKGQTLPAQESPAHNPPDTDSKIRDIGLTAGIVLVATALIGFLIYSYRMKLLRRSRQLENKPEGRSRHNEIPLLPLARDQTEHISGSGQENVSGEQPACSAGLNPPYAHYEEIRDVGTNSLESSSADKGMSQCHSVVEYENTLPVLKDK